MSEKRSHDDFILAHSKKKVKVMFDDAEVLKGSIDLHGSEEFKEKANQFLTFKKSEVYIWAVCILTLFTPLRFLFVCVVLYMAAKHFIYSSLKKYIVEEMKKSEDFYEQALDKKIVHLEYV